MKPAGRAAWLLVLLAWPTAAVAEDSPAERVLAEQPRELVSRLRDEGVVVLEDVANPHAHEFVIAYVSFQRPRREVVDLMVQSQRQTEYRPELREVKLIEESGHQRVDEYRMKIMFTSLVYRVRYQRDPETDRIDWSLDPEFDNDLRRLDGFWEFFAWGDGRTLGRFGSIVDVGPAVPRFIQNGMARRTVVRTVANVRHWIDSGGRWRP